MSTTPAGERVVSSHHLEKSTGKADVRLLITYAATVYLRVGFVEFSFVNTDG